MVMKVVIYGFGQIGRMLAEMCIKKGFELIEVIDINPSLVGRELSDFGIDSDVVIKDKLEINGGDIAFITTTSFLDEVYPQIEECIKNELNVLSTCETLVYPEYRYPELARKIDQLAKDYNVTVLGTGINPGFLLDTLPIILCATFGEVRRIKAVRCVDALKRRASFQKKIGLGLKSFKNVTGHVGYAESVLLICESLKIKPTKVKEDQKPIIKNGRIVGIKGFGCAYLDDEEIVRVEFQAYENAKEYEEIIIEGDNSVVWRSSGTKGDLGTVAILVNLAKAVVEHEPGLIKMTDLIPFKYI